MTAPKLVILQRLTALIESTPGYTLTGKVFRGRKFVATDEIDGAAISINESPRPSVGAGAGYEDILRREDWSLNIQGWAEDDKVNPSDPAYEMAWAVEQQLDRIIATNPQDGMGMGGQPTYPNDYLLGRTIAGLTTAGSLVLPEQTNLSRSCFWYIPLTISFVKRT